MRNIFLTLVFVLWMHVLVYSQGMEIKKEILSNDDLSLLIDSKNLYIDIKNNKPLHFQIWKNDEMVLNAKGNAKGIESFPVDNGKYKLIIINDNGKSKTEKFHINKIK